MLNASELEAWYGERSVVDVFRGCAMFRRQSAISLSGAGFMVVSFATVARWRSEQFNLDGGAQSHCGLRSEGRGACDGVIRAVISTVLKDCGFFDLLPIYPSPLSLTCCCIDLDKVYDFWFFALDFIGCWFCLQFVRMIMKKLVLFHVWI
ncbi:unnamed protein product [Lathyrus oleraceus]